MGAATQGVELRLVVHDEESGETDELNATEAVRSEAEAVARWLKHDIIGKELLVDASGRPRKATPGDVAMLFRTFSQGRHYLDALRRYGLGYLAEGEKHFYQRQEVVDLVNVLRCIQNPDDPVAQLGLMRSTLGALSDREVMELTALGALDYRQGAHARLNGHPKAEHLHRLYAVLRTLHEVCPRLPLPSAIDLIFEQLPVLELAAASAHGEQAMANLWKVRALTEQLVGDPVLTLAGLAELLAARIADPPDESEGGLAEESTDSVRVLTIHKAKGLEFPIVVLVGLQAGIPLQQNPIEVHHDWSTDLVGLRFEGVGTLEGVFIAEKLAARMTAEQRRLLYVGMTRAKERLVLSGALSRRPASGNFLALFQEAIGEAVGKQDVPELEVGAGRITQTILPPDEGKAWTWKREPSPVEAVCDLGDFVPRWHDRVRNYQVRLENPIIVTPSSLAAMGKALIQGQGSLSGAEPPLRGIGAGGCNENPGSAGEIAGAAWAGKAPVQGQRSFALALGSLAHTVLSNLSYDDNHRLIHEIIEEALDRELPPELQTERAAIRDELHSMLSIFTTSQAYAELCASTIVARELPFLMPLGSTSRQLPEGLMEGRIDLVYRKDGRLWVADYKTDRVTQSEMADRAEMYRKQATYYTQAVRAGFGEEPAGFNVIFVRNGMAIALPASLPV
jgi:ATP-dependent helicase/nuclease subunit A